MFPEGFIKRIKTQNYINPEPLMKALEEPSPVSIRVNKSKWNHKPLNSKPVPWSETGYFLDTRPSYTSDPLFHSGCYYPQEASSMFIEQVFRQHVDTSGPLKVLDLCGAPGGKSIHLSDMIGTDNLLVSNEVIRPRASVLSETLTKWGAGNVIVTQSDPSSFSSFKEYFDVILVDAPCSGEGMFRTEVAMNEWSEANAIHCSERQKRILNDVWPSLKNNGLLIYSTCTFNPAENEENIKWLIEKHKAVALEMDLSGFSGIQEIELPPVKGYGFYPDKTEGEGFFIAVVRKNEGGKNTNYHNYRSGDMKPSNREVEAVKNWIKGDSRRFMKRGDDIWLLPCNTDEYERLYKNLKIIKAGTRIATVKNNDFLPAHDLALSAFAEDKVFPSIELNYDEAVAFLRRDNINARPGLSGWNLVSYRGVNLGFVKNLEKRLNNYFPVEWRIRMEVPVNSEKDLIKWD
jgi:16S rRNA C967 or C1407 C5-methylase (RsmB/RsmF family)/NOL1/NOP2/fmu family ribosome biogenesis protein